MISKRSSAILFSSLFAMMIFGSFSGTAHADTYIVYGGDSANWTVPAGVTSIDMSLVGGGGGGGGGNTSSSYLDNSGGVCGGGGGSGGWRYGTLAVRAGQVISMIAGRGGAPGAWG